MTALRVAHAGDLSVAELLAEGVLSLATAPALRTAVLKALTGEPRVVLIDVRGLKVADDITLTAFPMFVRHGTAVGTTIALLRPSPVLRAQLDGLAVVRDLLIFGTRAEALAACAKLPGPRRVELFLAAAPSSTALARSLVTAFCTRWQLPHLTDNAALIVTELVANAIAHAGTPMTVSVLVRRPYLHIGVRDGSGGLPRRYQSGPERESGRGLLIIEALSAAWGYTETTAGKVVWATLRLTRPAVA